MNHGGIQDLYWERMRDIFLRQPKIARVILFGSRAMGHFREGSDIDLAIETSEGESLSHSEWMAILAALDEVGLLQRFDLVPIQATLLPELAAHIRRVGQTIFEKPHHSPRH